MSDMEEKDESTLSQPFNVAPRPKTAETYILQALHSRVSGDGAEKSQKIDDLWCFPLQKPQNVVLSYRAL